MLADCDTAVLAGLTPEERTQVAAKALAVRQHELEQLDQQLQTVSHEQSVAGANARHVKNLAIGNQALVQTASERVAELQAQLHAAMLDEEFVLEQQLAVEREAGMHASKEAELGRARQEAEVDAQWVGKSVQDLNSV